MKDLACKTIVFAAALISTIAVSNVPSASELSNRYGYVGFEPEVELAVPFGRATVNIYDQNGALLVSDELPAGAVVRYKAQDLGLSGLYYIKIVSDKLIACAIFEDWGDGEGGGTVPQSRLFDTYSIGFPSPNSTGDDFVRIFTPRRMIVRVYDQDHRLVAKYAMGRGQAREFNVRSDWGLSSPYAVIIRGEKPFAISWLDGPGVTTLLIPPGFDSLP